MVPSRTSESKSDRPGSSLSGNALEGDPVVVLDHMTRIPNLHIDSGFGLVEALSVRRGDVVSLVGAGGKTTVLYALATELRRHGLSVVVTCTTHMQVPTTGATAPPLVVIDEEDNWLTSVKRHLDRYGSVTVIQDRKRDDKLRGLEPVMLDPLRSLADAVVIEADGARGRSLKAPAEYEPVVPDETTLMVVLVGLDVLDERLDAEHVHRLEVVVELSGAVPGTEVTEDVVVDCVVRGYIPKVPKGSRHVVFLNKATDYRLKTAERLGERLLAAGAEEVVFGQAERPHECFYRMRLSGRS
jgi:probable selenium-dependent hydroxylase accessory protein YqeC